jgi:prevent-host-death family protein
MMRIVLDKDVKPLSEFRATVAASINQVQKTKRPVVITHHGKSAAVLLDVFEYENLLQKMEILEDIRMAEQQLAEGKGVAHETAMKKVLARVM